MSTLIEYDDQTFSSAKELRAYLKLQSTFSGETLSDSELENQVAVVIESQLEDVFDDVETSNTVSLETLQEEESLEEFDSYDSEKELYF